MERTLTQSEMEVPNPLQKEGIEKHSLLKKIWDFDLKKSNFRVSKPTKVLVVLFGFCLWLLFSLKIQFINSATSSESIRAFHQVEEIPFSKIDDSIIPILIGLSFIRVLFGLIVGLLDIKLHKNITGKDFDWRGMVNIGFTNLAIFLFSFAFLIFTPLLPSFIAFYDTVIESIPSVFNFNGVLAVIVAVVIGDFCFYWCHRLSHNIRLLWNLGHINHHRHENLTQFHFAAEPNVLLLESSNIARVLLIPLLGKLFTFDIAAVGWSLVVLLIIDAFIDPSHSPVLYSLENRFKALRLMRYIFVTPAVHYIHHSKEPRHSKKTGCNFSARLTIWDRLFGTYVEPDTELPETGLFGTKTDYCYNPIRFIFLPYYRFYLELKRNSIKHWIPILFGPTSYSPPVKAKISH